MRSRWCYWGSRYARWVNLGGERRTAEVIQGHLSPGVGWHSTAPAKGAHLRAQPCHTKNTQCAPVILVFFAVDRRRGSRRGWWRWM